jgi:hypothetical protein
MAAPITDNFFQGCHIEKKQVENEMRKKFTASLAALRHTDDSS